MIKIEILGKSWEFNISFHVIYFSLAFCDFSFVTLFMKNRWNLLSIGNFTSLCNYELFKRLEFYIEYIEFYIYIIIVVSYNLIIEIFFTNYSYSSW